MKHSLLRRQRWALVSPSILLGKKHRAHPDGLWAVGCAALLYQVKDDGICPITSWQIGGETMETMTDFIFLGSKITADDDRSHDINRHLLLGRKVMTNLDSILKSKDITLLIKDRLVKAMVFPVIMYGCKCWTIKKTEH